MRLKILFFPLILVVSISVFIVSVWPEISEIRKISSENKMAMEKLALIKEKKDIVRSLDQDLGKNSDKDKLVKVYLAENKNEERVISAVSYLAASSGVSLANVSIEGGINNVPEEAEEIEDIEESKSAFSRLQSDPDDLSAPDVPVNLKSVSFKFTITGKYENMKSFLAGMNKMELMNDIKNVDISVQKPEVKEGEEPQPVDILSAEISSDFYYLEKIKARGNYGLASLNDPNFDFAQVEKIKQFITQGSSAMESGEKGSRNPFVAF